MSLCFFPDVGGWAQARAVKNLSAVSSAASALYLSWGLTEILLLALNAL